MNYTDEQKKEIREAVEGLGQQYYEDLELAKENLTILAKQVDEVVGLKPATFKKLVKTLYKANLEEENEKHKEFDNLYREILDVSDL